MELRLFSVCPAHHTGHLVPEWLYSFTSQQTLCIKTNEGLAASYNDVFIFGSGPICDTVLFFKDDYALIEVGLAIFSINLLNFVSMQSYN